MTAKCQCQYCNGDIEFEVSEFQESHRDPYHIFGQKISCPNCGLETELSMPAFSASNPKPPSCPVPEKIDAALQAPAISGDESVFFQDGNVTVTNARFLVGAKTFAMRSVTSIEIVTSNEPSSRPGWDTRERFAGYVFLVLILLGLVLWLGVGLSFWVVILLGIVGFAIVFLVFSASTETRPVFRILLKTAGGDVIAYQSFDQTHISQIVKALNDSIIAQG